MKFLVRLARLDDAAFPLVEMVFDLEGVDDGSDARKVIRRIVRSHAVVFAAPIPEQAGL